MFASRPGEVADLLNHEAAGQRSAVEPAEGLCFRSLGDQTRPRRRSRPFSRTGPATSAAARCRSRAAPKICRVALMPEADVGLCREAEVRNCREALVSRSVTTESQAGPGRRRSHHAHQEHGPPHSNHRRPDRRRTRVTHCQGGSGVTGVRVARESACATRLRRGCFSRAVFDPTRIGLVVDRGRRANALEAPQQGQEE